MRLHGAKLLAVLCTLVLFAPPGPAIAEDEPDISDAHIKKLVAQLTSPNAAPKVHGNGGLGPSAKYPPGYDKDAQKRVRSARSELNRLGLKAFPYLLDQFGNKQYCMTVDDGPAETNHSVGQACAGIVRCRLEPYNSFGYTAGEDDPRTRARRPCYSERFLADRQAARKWWEAHKDKTLFELQVEVLKWSSLRNRVTNKTILRRSETT